MPQPNPNGGNKKKQNISGDHTKDMRLKITADIKDANKSLKKLQEGVSKLGDLSNRGNNQQRGFLTPKQVQDYRKILKNMEKEYEKHQKRLQQIEQEYNKRKTEANKRANKRLRDLNEAESRGVVQGDPLTDGVNQYYRRKYKEARSTAEGIENDPKLLGQMEGLRQAVSQLGEEVRNSQPHQESINNMHQQNPVLTNITNGALGLLTKMGTVMSIGALYGYTTNGAKMLRRDEYSSAVIGQKLGYNPGETDADIRNRLAKLGEKNQYNVTETLATQSALLKGGYHNSALLDKDTQTAQQFGRAYGVDPNEFAESGTMLKKMGTLKDGDMQRFANLIAGSISKTKMNGREEEALRATTGVLSQVSNNLVSLSEDQASNVVGLQTTIGEAIPTLNGDRGATMLSNMDSAIKNGDNAFDILMGKGTKYVGIEGQYQLDLQKEQGLANPKNLQDFFQGVDRTGASETEKAYMATKLGLTLNEEKALRESGLEEKFKNGDFNVTNAEKEALRQSGATNLLDNIEKWGDTQSYTQTNNDSQLHNLQESTSKPYDRTAKGVLSGFNKLPNWMQGTMIWGGGLGGGLLLGKLRPRITEFLTKGLTSTIGNGGGFKDIGTLLKNIFRGGSGMWSGAQGMFGNPISKIKGSDIFTGAKNLMSSAGTSLKNLITHSGGSGGSGLFSSIGSKMKSLLPTALRQGEGVLGTMISTGAKMSANAGHGVMGAASKYGGKALGAMGKMGKFAGKALPLIGGLLDVGIDRMQNPNTNWGRSIFKGIGGMLGGALGLAGTGLAGIGTGGWGAVATAGLTAAGGIAGNTAGDKLYSWLFGEDDLKKANNTPIPQQGQNQQYQQTQEIPATIASSIQTQKVSTMTVDTLEVKNQNQSMSRLEDTKSVNNQNIGDLMKTTEDTGASETEKAYMRAKFGLPMKKTDKTSKDIDKKIDSVGSEHKINIVISGKIEGMNDKTQEQIKDSMDSFWNRILGKTGSDSSMDLSYSYTNK